MCFSGGSKSANTNLHPAGYTPENSQSAVTMTTTPDPVAKADTSAPTVAQPEPVAQSALSGLNLKGM